MTIFTYSPTIPNPPDDPADDVSQMQTNSASIFGLIAVDHVGFNLTNGGQHKQVTFNAPLAADPGQPTPISTLYTKTSSSSNTQDLYFQNGSAVSGVNQVTGGGGYVTTWAQFSSGGGPYPQTLASNSFNVASVVQTAVGTYTVNFIRNYVSTFGGFFYAMQITASLNSTGFAVQIQSRNTNSMSFTVRSGGAAVNSGEVNVTINGTLV